MATPATEAPGPLEGREKSRAVRRIAANVGSLVAADIVNKTMMFGFFVLAARHLRAEGFGVLSFALAYTAMFSVFSDLGLGVHTSREVARSPDLASHYVGNAMGVKLVLSVVLAVFMIVSARLLGYPWDTVRAVTAISPLVLVGSWNLYLGSVFQGFERMHLTAAARLLQAVILLTGAAVLLRFPPSVDAFVLLYVLGAAAALILLLAAVRGVFRWSLSFSPAAWIALVRKSWPLGVAAVLAMLYYWNGSALLARLVGDGELGIYSAAFKLVLGLGFASAAFAGALYPLMSRHSADAGGQLSRTLRRGLRYIILAAVALGVIGGVLSEVVIGVLYGAGYERAVAVLRLLCWWGAFMYVNAMLAHFFYAIGEARVVMWQTGMALGINVIANLLLVPSRGASGAAVAILLAEGASMLFLLVCQRRTHVVIGNSTLLKAVARGIGAAVPAGLVAWLLRSHVGLWALPCSLAAYLMALLALGGITRDDLELVRVLLRGRREVVQQ